jgi:hypothetical protein
MFRGPLKEENTGKEYFIINGIMVFPDYTPENSTTNTNYQNLYQVLSQNMSNLEPIGEPAPTSYSSWCIIL